MNLRRFLVGVSLLLGGLGALPAVNGLAAEPAGQKIRVEVEGIR